MRLLLIGTPDGRARLRAELDESSFTIAANSQRWPKRVRRQSKADAFLISAPAGRAFTARPSSLSTSHLAVAEYAGVRSPRAEFEVLELLAEGSARTSRSQRVSVSAIRPVKFHVASICGKLGAANRTQAVRPCGCPAWLDSSL
jgi:ATP/maltotriose-dependent transcriptional regulator MalT